MKRALAARGSQDTEITQPRDYFFGRSLYRRSTEWRSEMPPLPVEEPEEAENADPEMALLTKRYASRLSKADSVEELMKSYYSDCGTAKSRAAAATTKSSSGGATGDSEEADSGRSTPGETNKS